MARVPILLTVEKTERKHAGELFRLVTIKKSYHAMVALEGKAAVDRRLLISELQAKRRAYTTQGRTMDSLQLYQLQKHRFIHSQGVDQFHKLSTQKSGEEKLTPVERVSTAMLY